MSIYTHILKDNLSIKHMEDDIIVGNCETLYDNQVAMMVNYGKWFGQPREKKEEFETRVKQAREKFECFIVIYLREDDFSSFEARAKFALEWTPPKEAIYNDVIISHKIM